jgi:hypothetical protein
MIYQEPPKIIGPPREFDCERCHFEPAEHRVREYMCEGVPLEDEEPLDWDLCETCWQEMFNESFRTAAESMDYWEKRHDHRLDPEEP